MRSCWPGGLGAAALLDLLIGRPRGIAHLVAATFFVLNPYTVVFTARTTITLSATRRCRGCCSPSTVGSGPERGWRAWWWPAAFALIITSTGGGVNAAVVFCMLGPGSADHLRAAMGHVPWRGAGGFVVRAALLSLVVSLWWIFALLAQARYGINFLQYTEQPRTIWGTNGISESIRLMGYWTSYIGGGYPKPGFPYFSDGRTLLFNVPVVGASFLLPALAILAFVWTRRWRYAPFFVLMIVVGVTIMAAGFPDGTPLRSSMEWIYYHVFVTAFSGRRQGGAAPRARARLPARPRGTARLALAGARDLRRWRTPALIAAPTALAALILVAAWPLVEGKAIDSQLTWKQIPTAWRQVGKALDQSLATNTRAIVLPGDVFAYYKWGGTVDAILPRLTKRPVAIRYETPYADLHADDLLGTIDSLVQQNRAYPGQLQPLLGLIGAGSVIQGIDDDTRRDGAVDPAMAALALSSQGLGTPRGYGRLSRSRRHRVTSVPPRNCRRSASSRSPAAAGSSTSTRAARRSSTARRRAWPTWRRSGRCPPTARSSMPETWAPRDRRRRQDREQHRRHRLKPAAFFLPQFTQQNVGPVLTQTDPITKAEADVDPFPSAGSAGQTVTVLQGVRVPDRAIRLRLESVPGAVAAAAFDGKLSTAWVPYGGPRPTAGSRVGFEHPMDVPYVDIYPVTGIHGRTTSVAVGSKVVAVHPAGSGSRSALTGSPACGSRSLRVEPRQAGGPGGIREIRIPGVHVPPLLRPPLLVSRALAGRDTATPALSWLFARQTADGPFRRDRYVDEPGATRTSSTRRIPRAPSTAVLVSPRPPLLRRRCARHPPRRPPIAVRPPRRRAQPRAVHVVEPLSNDPATGPPVPSTGPRHRLGRPLDPAPASAAMDRLATLGGRSPSTGCASGGPLPVRRPTRIALSWAGGSTGALAVPRRECHAAPVASARGPPASRSLMPRSGRGPRAPGPHARVGIGAVRVAGLAPVRCPMPAPLRAPCGASP